MSTVNLKWVGGTLMVGADSRGQTLVMSRWPGKDPEWKGMKPSDLLLLSVASCSSYDVVTILEKQRQPLESLEVVCTGEQKEEPPRGFTRIHLQYQLIGNVKPDKAAKAIQLSMDKYCSVVNSLDPAIEVSHDFEIQG